MHSVMQQPFKTAVLILVWGWLLFLVLAPNLLVVGASVMTRDPVSFLSLPLNLDAYRQLFDPLYLEVFLHSLYMAAMTTLVCLLIGYPFAWALSKVGKQRQLILIFLLIVPFWRLLPRVGIPSWVAIVAVVPFVALVLLWIVAFSRWTGPRDETGE